ncbi:heterokaryon incompatibility protein [Fusarium austroafricanum]|uniref:Heterokaryon incompatibility protein n=1 Tax=Fusarium austroafricanum TaxID=2364996 RepID=A0A8H4KWD3_9HYPO|nr:heterokaryon incompatibility protein [Fusarium austroafricanum]
MFRSPRSFFGITELGNVANFLKPGACHQHQELLASYLSLDTPHLAKDINALATARKASQVVLVRTPLHSSTVIKIILPLQPQLPKPPVAGLYAVRQSHDNEDFIGGRVLHPQWIDESLPRLWKSVCTRLHGDLCGSISDKSLPTVRPTWLVDVQEMRLVPAPQDCSYVALSYVWGSQNTLEANQSNIKWLQKKGSLSSQQTAIQVATTVRDAMGIVKLLDERYLWVDTLCIIQDDASHKHMEMSKMSDIYANATVAIMAVQGEHANSGLRGFRGVSEPRNLWQSVHCLQGTIVTMHPVTSVHHELGTDSPIWQTRGWTYQENLFARRRLIFDGDSIRWECSTCVMSEHIESSQYIKPLGFGVPDGQALFRRSIPDLYQLQRVLRDYNTRSFTYPEDALNAFAGMAFSLSPALSGCFISGLPAAFFGIALLWQPSERITRRTAKGQGSNHCLPSWSWAGWMGRVDFDCASASDFIRNGFLNGAGSGHRKHLIEPSLYWRHHETPESEGVPIQASILECRAAWLDGKTELSDGWSVHPVSEIPNVEHEPPRLRPWPDSFFKHKDHPGHCFWYPIPLLRQEDRSPGILAPYISCKTRRATLFLEMSDTVYRELPLLDSKKDWAGRMRIHNNREMQSENYPSLQAIELVEVAKGFSQRPLYPETTEEISVHPQYPNSVQGYEYYNVMWIEWTDGVAYRKGLGEVVSDVWVRERGEEFTLMLG